MEPLQGRNLVEARHVTILIYPTSEGIYPASLLGYMRKLAMVSFAGLSTEARHGKLTHILQSEGG